MKQCSGVPAGILILLLAGVTSGCGKKDTEEKSSDQEEIKTPIAKETKQPPAEKLELKLKEGDRFPLRKTVVQTLSEPQEQGTVEHKSHLELLLELKLDKVQQDGMKLFSVRYHRVRYGYDINGERVEFNSAVPPTGPVPPEVQAYYGLVNNGFSFWIGPDNQVRQVNHFDVFLQNCVRHVPAEQRRQVFEMLSRTAGNDAIANFVDDSIGLLPYKKDVQGRTTVRLNDSWVRQRLLPGQVPMQLLTTYNLQSIDQQVAKIDIAGKITSGAEDVTSPGQQQIRGRLLNGDSLGTCTIDRHTGLPRKSQVLRNMNLLVELPDGQKIKQHKRILTTIETWTDPQKSNPLSIGREQEPATVRKNQGASVPSRPVSFPRKQP